MNSQQEHNIEMSVEIDKNPIYSFTQTVTEDNIIESAKAIEKMLISNQAKPEKIQNVFEIIVEIMQNMLNYSYGSRSIDENKKEGYGSFSLSYFSNEDTYVICSGNEIANSQQKIIEERVKEIEGLDSQALRKLLREKMRSKKDIHDKGAGLGFATIAKKCIAPIEINFIPTDKEGVLLFEQKLTI